MKSDKLGVERQIACVTGASGMVGTRIVKKLLRKNFHVRVLSRKKSYPIAEVDFFNGGLEDEHVLKEFCSGAHLMFHCAAEKSDESLMRAVNVEGTRRLLKIVEASSVHYFCYISSAGVIGRTQARRVDEKTACRPQTLYETTKLEAEKMVADGLPDCRAVILRPTNVIDEKRPGAIHSFLFSPVISLISGILKGAESAHILHADDVAEAAIHFIDRTEKSTEIYFVSRDDDAENKYSRIREIIGLQKNPEGEAFWLSRYHIPMWAAKLNRRLFLRADIPPDACFSAEKLLSTGFRFNSSFSEIIISVINSEEIENVEENRGAQLLSGGLWALGGKIAVSVFNIAINATLARLLSVNEMGGYFIALSFVMVAAVFAQFGLNYAIVRVVAEELSANRPRMAVRAVIFSFKFTGGVVAFLSFFIALKGGYWITSFVFDSVILSEVTGVLAIWVAVMALQHLLGETFRGFADIRFATIFAGILPSAMVLFFTIGIWIAIGHSNLKQVITLFIIASTISIMVGGVNLWRLCRRVCQNGDSPGNESGMEHILSISWPMWITNLLLFVLAQADLWVLGIFHVEGGVALYGAGSRLAILILTPLLIINAVLPPHVAELHTKKRKAEFEQIMRSTATISGIIGFFLFILLGIFGKPILGIIFGEYYRNAATVLLLLSFGQFVTVWAGSCGIALMMTGHQILMMVITVVSGVISILLAIALVKQYGPEGVAFATTMGLVFQSLAMVTAVKVKVDVWTPMYIPLRALG